MVKNTINIKSLWDEVRGESAKNMTLSSSAREVWIEFIEEITRLVLDDAIMSAKMGNHKSINKEDMEKAIRFVCYKEEKE